MERPFPNAFANTPFEKTLSSQVQYLASEHNQIPYFGNFLASEDKHLILFDNQLFFFVNRIFFLTNQLASFVKKLFS
jgi:hypothetical protein